MTTRAVVREPATRTSRSAHANPCICFMDTAPLRLATCCVTWHLVMQFTLAAVRPQRVAVGAGQGGTQHPDSAMHRKQGFVIAGLPSRELLGTMRPPIRLGGWSQGRALLEEGERCWRRRSLSVRNGPSPLYEPDVTVAPGGRGGGRSAQVCGGVVHRAAMRTRAMTGRATRGRLTSEFEDLKARHLVVVRVLGRDRKVVCESRGRNPGIIDRHPFPRIAERYAQRRPCVGGRERRQARDRVPRPRLSVSSRCAHVDSSAAARTPRRSSATVITDTATLRGGDPATSRSCSSAMNMDVSASASSTASPSTWFIGSAGRRSSPGGDRQAPCQPRICSPLFGAVDEDLPGERTRPARQRDDFCDRPSIQVTRNRSPLSTRRSTALTSLRRSRAGMSVMRRS